MFDVLKNTNDSVLFAMGENVSSGYTSGKHPWPARVSDFFEKIVSAASQFLQGRGLNAGLGVFHLERMRWTNWTDMWKKEAKEHLKGMKRPFGTDQAFPIHFYLQSSIIAIQDIHNLLTISHPNIYVELPCEYNFQLGKNALPLTCQTNDRLVKVKIIFEKKFHMHSLASNLLFRLPISTLRTSLI